MNLGVIPARYDSSRLPGKLLADLDGRPVLQHVYDRCCKSKLLDQIVIATDDGRIATLANKIGAICIMTSKDHQSGTDRCFEALKYFQDVESLVNIQGDEPFINPNQIDRILNILSENEEAEIATLVKRTDDVLEMQSSNVVKCVFDNSHYALYFSRLPIPYRAPGSADFKDCYKHIGMYGFRGKTCAKLSKLNRGKLEMSERLEQLRWLENGYRIKIGIATEDTLGIDTQEDLDLARKRLDSV